MNDVVEEVNFNICHDLSLCFQFKENRAFLLPRPYFMHTRGVIRTKYFNRCPVRVGFGHCSVRTEKFCPIPHLMHTYMELLTQTHIWDFYVTPFRAAF